MRMDFSVDAAVEVLTRTPGTLKGMLSDLPSAWTSATEGPDTWSPQDVVGHLIHGEETDWIPRAKIILTKGESQAFEPFDRFAQARRFTGWSLERLLDRFAELRAEGVATLRPWGRGKPISRCSRARRLTPWRRRATLPSAVEPFMHPASRTVIQTVPVPIERVFALLTDPGRMAEWLPGYAGTQSDKPLRKGVRFKVRFGQRMTEFEVVDFTPPTTFGWVERGEGNGGK